MPRPPVNWVTFSIDGREVTAPEGSMLVDGAKYGDVEIPVFCYEPKLGQPVGACRMCLVEIEGIPKLQTGCSTPVKDGMVVHTQTDRVHEAQRAVVEFLLINHPLDCPVCDKGGECPLQDITYGWGPGTSRYVEPKRHFKKPLELSPLIAIDRERCILCYRCVRFSQEISEDYQLVLLERGTHSYVGTFDGHPYVAPFSGNIVELCPVGALTSRAYRFRARPWDIEGAGTICTGCSAHCNVELTVRDERVMRVLGRDNEGVDDGWLCDRGRFGYQHVHADERIVEPLVREGTELMPAPWEKALAAASSALKKAGGRVAALADGETSNEEAFLLQRLFREGLGSGDLASRPRGEVALDVARALADPALQASIPDLEFAHAVLVVDCDPLDDAPVLDLRIRKGLRRHHTKLVVASARPTALDSQAAATMRLAPGSAAGAAGRARRRARGRRRRARRRRHGGRHERAGGARPGDVAARRRRGPRDRVRRPRADRRRGARAAQPRGPARAARQRRRRPAGDPVGAERARHPRGRLRARARPRLRPGRGGRPRRPRDRRGAGLGRAVDDLAQLRRPAALPSRPRAVGHGARDRAGRDRGRERAHRHGARARRRRVPRRGVSGEGGHAHQRRRARAAPAAGDRPGAGPLRAARHRRAAGLAGDRRRRAGVRDRPGVLSGAMASAQLFAAVPFYDGLTLDEIGGRGIRWPETAAGQAWHAEWQPAALDVPPAAPSPNGSLRLGTWRSLWAAKEVDVSPLLKFLRVKQIAELSPEDAERLGVREGDRVEIGGGTRVTAPVKLRRPFRRVRVPRRGRA